MTFAKDLDLSSIVLEGCEEWAGFGGLGVIEDLKIQRGHYHRGDIRLGHWVQGYPSFLNSMVIGPMVGCIKTCYSYGVTRNMI